MRISAITIALVALGLSGCETTGLQSPSRASLSVDNDRIEVLERELHETKKRVSILESMLRNKQEDNEPVITSDGWKSLANW